jgi:hypothetical protein
MLEMKINIYVECNVIFQVHTDCHHHSTCANKEFSFIQNQKIMNKSLLIFRKLAF